MQGSPAPDRHDDDEEEEDGDDDDDDDDDSHQEGRSHRHFLGTSAKANLSTR